MRILSAFLAILLFSSCATTGRPNVHSVLVWRHGALVSETYTAGTDRTLADPLSLFATTRTFDAESLHDVRSVSKSLVGLETGVVLARHPEVTIDTPVAGFFPELKDLGPGREGITLRHLLTMSSGLAWNEWGQGMLTSDETGLDSAEAPARKFFEKPVRSSPGTVFNYSGGSTQTLMLILERLEKRPFLELVQEDLFGPLGITGWQWVKSTHGEPLAYSGLRLTSREMGAIGLLVLAHGQWNGRSVVPAAWVDEVLRTQIETGLDLFSLDGQPSGYGYQWWTGRVRGPQGPVTWVSAIGNGGQRIFVVPDLDLVCVVTAGDYGDPEIQRTVGKLIAEVVSRP